MIDFFYQYAIDSHLCLSIFGYWYNSASNLLVEKSISNECLQRRRFKVEYPFLKRSVVSVLYIKSCRVFWNGVYLAFSLSLSLSLSLFKRRVSIAVPVLKRSIFSVSFQTQWGVIRLYCSCSAERQLWVSEWVSEWVRVSGCVGGLLSGCRNKTTTTTELV